MSGRGEIVGVAFALTSATAFGATTVVAKFAFREDVNVSTLLAVRFTLGAIMLWGLVRLTRTPVRLPRSRFWLLVVLGGVLYATQSRLFFESLTRIPAATAGLLLYAYPAIVALLALAVGRERLTVVKAGALALALGGAGLVLGAPAERLDGGGVAFGIASATMYAIYVLAADRGIRGLHPLVASAAIVTGGAVSFTATGAVSGTLRFDLGAAGWAWLLLLGFISITVAVSTFLLAVERIGPTGASIASTWEPVFTVLLAAVTLDERLGALQLVGGGLVVAAVASLALAGRRRATIGEMPVEVEG